MLSPAPPALRAASKRVFAVRTYAMAAPLRQHLPARISDKLVMKRAPKPTPMPPGTKDHRTAGAERPHLGTRVRPDHGLWRFFRRAPDEDGTERHHAIEPMYMLHKRAGASCCPFRAAMFADRV
jgi:hypothetical protein